MWKADMTRVITPELIQEYIAYLREQEKSESTIQQYAYTINTAFEYFGTVELTKNDIIHWKDQLSDQYANTSINVKIAALNGFFHYMGWGELTVKPLKIQEAVFSDAATELTREEYERLVLAAERMGNRRLSLVIQTICGAGIRVSELKFITVEAIHAGSAKVNNKGKHRTILLTGDLCKLLSDYAKENDITRGPIFVTRSGKPLDRSNIWRDMKRLCAAAKVDDKKVFPHNLRHLFARIYYTMKKDLSRLADILGHTNINTTRIYTKESGTIHAQQIEELGLILTT